jgi:hypothetical protein
MSNALAIAAVTATLRNLLDAGLNADVPGTKVTTQPLDRAKDNAGSNRVNLFLYHTGFNVGWRNQPMLHVAQGETGQPPLALDLFYLLTAYGQGDDDPVPVSHRLLGLAMRILHDHPVLGAAELQASFPANDLFQQVERVRITPQTLTVDEMHKLWTSFQTQYRISAAYQASVVLIESTRPILAPLPVLTRNVQVQLDLSPPLPTLTGIKYANQQTSARLGEVVTLSGLNLSGTSVTVQFIHPRRAPVNTAPLVGAPTDTQIQVQVPNEPANWPAGIWGVQAVISRTGQPDRTTNQIPLALAPTIENITPNPAARDGQGKVTLTLTVAPETLPDQSAMLLAGGNVAVAQPHTTLTPTLTFTAGGLAAGDAFVRLRIDGVDSILINRAEAPPVYDLTQKVTIT